MEFLLNNYINILIMIAYMLIIFLFKMHKTPKSIISYCIIGFALIQMIYEYLFSINIIKQADIGWALAFLELYLFCLLAVDNRRLAGYLFIIPLLLGWFNILDLHTLTSVNLMTILLFGVMGLTFIIITMIRQKNISLLPNIASLLVVCLAYVLNLYYTTSSQLMITTVLICSTLVFAIVIIKTYSQNRVEEEKKIQMQKTSITISQIQPHFLYNSLATIGYICKKDPAKASDAIDKFSDYLRANLNSLKQEHNIPFSEELKHVETYLWLEKLRFEERLNIVYDIETDDFLVPPLSIQPLVENAVKHGICEKVEGGTLTIRTIEYNETIKIVIQDDGVGFDTKKKPNDGKIHVGIQNVRARIQNMANGTLVIQSQIGVGTTQTITLPKKGNK